MLISLETTPIWGVPWWSSGEGLQSSHWPESHSSVLAWSSRGRGPRAAIPMMESDMIGSTVACHAAQQLPLPGGPGSVLGWGTTHPTVALWLSKKKNKQLIDNLKCCFIWASILKHNNVDKH